MSRNLPLEPFELVLPNPITSDVGLVGALHHPPERFVVVAVQLRRIEALGALFDEGVEVVGLLEVKVVLTVVRVLRDELAANRALDLDQDGLHMSQQIGRSFSSHGSHSGWKRQRQSRSSAGVAPMGDINVAGREADGPTEPG